MNILEFAITIHVKSTTRNEVQKQIDDLQDNEETDSQKSRYHQEAAPVRWGEVSPELVMRDVVNCHVMQHYQ